MDNYYANSLLPIIEASRGQYKSPANTPVVQTLEDPFDRSRALVNRLVVRPTAATLSGLSGVGAAMLGKDALAGQEAMTNLLAPLVNLSEPQTDAGKRIAGYVDYPFEKLAQLSNVAGDWVLDKTGSPVLATAAGTVIQAAPMAIGGIKGTVKPAPKKSAIFKGEIPHGTVALNESMGRSLYEALSSEQSMRYNESKGGLRNVNRPQISDQGITAAETSTQNVPGRSTRYDVNAVATELGTTPEAVRSAATDYSLQGRQSEAFKSWAGNKPVHRIESVDMENPQPGVVLVKSSQFKGLEKWDSKLAKEQRISLANDEQFWGTTTEKANLHGLTRPQNTTSEYYIKSENPVSIQLESIRGTKAKMREARDAGHDVAYLHDKTGSRYIVSLNPESPNIKSRSNIGTFSPESTNYMYEGVGEATKTALDPIFKPVDKPEKTQMWRADWGENLKEAQFSPSSYGWVDIQPEMGVGKRFAPSKMETFHGLTTPAEDWVARGKDIKSRLEEDYLLRPEDHQWSAGRPAPGSRMVQVNHQDLKRFFDESGMTEQEITKYLTDQGITHLRVNNMMTDTGEVTPSREVVQLVPETTKIRGRKNLYEAMGEALYNAMKGIPYATQTREE